ncbi:MAG: ACT domain-containing protein [Candidatus Micrarchaeota archaeon]
MKLEPKPAKNRYFFAIVDESQLMALSGMLDSVVAILREDEGLTVVFSEDIKDDIEGLSEKPAIGPFALISMAAETDLNAVGILAKITAALAKEKVAVNPFSGYLHDHIFVPSDKKDAAMATLKALEI